MTITATEFKNNMGKYLDLLQTEDITITKNGKRVGVLVNPDMRTLENLCGILKGAVPDDIDAKEIKRMRLREKYEVDI